MINKTSQQIDSNHHILLKVFLVEKGTFLEREVNKLMVQGVTYIPTFEGIFDITGLCNEIKILFNENISKEKLFLIIRGTSEIKLNRFFYEHGVDEITIEKLKSLLSYKQFSRPLGTEKLFKSISYKVEFKLPKYRVWKITSFEK